MRALVLMLIALLAATASHARAAVRAESDSARIALARHVSPGDRLQAGDFSILLWVHPDAPTMDARGIFEIPGVLSICTSAGGTLVASVEGEDGQGQLVSLVADSGQPLLGGQWQLVALSFRQSGFVDILHADSTGVHSGIASAGGAVMPAQQGELGPCLGADSQGRPALIGSYGLLVFRSHVVKANDLTTIRSTRRYFGPYDLSGVGSMNGVAGAEWMLNHAATTLPVNIDAGGLASQRAAVMGQPAGLHNIHVYDKRDAVGSEYERFNLVRQAIDVRDFRYVSTREPPLDGFFMVDPGPFAVTYPSVPGESALAVQLVNGPRRPIRMFISSNSRAVFRDDGSGQSPGNYAHGFFDLKRSEVSGVLFRPAVRGSGGPWFGLDCVDPPRAELTDLIDTASGVYASFSRFWTGSARATSEAPGSGLFLRRWGTYEMRCRPEEGSLMVADAPLVVEAHVMAFPGASPVLWRPRRGAWQSETGIDEAPSQQMTLDTTRHVHMFGLNDRVLNHSAISLVGNFEGLIKPGDAMFIGTGPNAGQINVVNTVTQGISQATITFDRNMLRWPEAGVYLRFGSWRFETLRYEFPPVPPGDARTWRGLFLQAVDEGSGFPVFAYSAYRPNVPGLQIGVAGWGGNGYLLQLLKSEPAAMQGWMQKAAADLWIQVPAQQNALPSNMSDFTAAIRQATPDCEIIWAAEAAHPSGSQLGWPQYIVDHAAEEGVIGIVAYNQPHVGTELEQLADGHRANLPHISRRGNIKLAELWCQLLQSAAIDPCPADFAPVWGQYDFFDVQAYLAAFSTGDPRSDLNGDGAINFFDVQRFLMLFTAGCP
ncbi:MAG: hypothetical protein KJZ65_04550 [Phycisphaerales bacterium]|nr:hypothetical protein [Phycisphaerales bacterium]